MKEPIKRKLRIYIDTSVVGGFFDEIFEVETKALFQRLENREVIFVVSDLLEYELEKPTDKPHLKELLKKYDKNCFEYVKTTPDAEALADCYIAEKVISRKFLDDCRHIAIATINKVDVLASWNFKHIVNFDKIKMYNSVNLKNSYTLIEIRNPKELLNYEVE